MKKQTCIIGNILLLLMFLLLSMTAKAQSYTSCVGGNPIYLPDPNVPSPYTLMWAQYSYAGSELYVVNNKVTIEKYFVGTIYVECYYKCVRQYTVAGHVYEDHQTNTTYFGIKCDPVYTIGLPNQLTMQVGETKTIDWSYSPSYVSRPNLSWSSSDYSVVDVNSNKLTAKRSGRAVVTVKSNAGPDEYINVTVEGGADVIYVNSISLNESSVSLTEGSTKQLQATVLPSNATDKSVSWTSSNNSVAQVSSSGLVTAKSVGTATITCKANDGSGKSATCSVTVKSSNVEPVSIVLPNYIENIKVGQTITLVPTIAPSNATTTLSWTSSDNSVATVTQSGVVKGIKAGESKITVTTSNGKSAYCYVKVTEDVVYVSSISLNATSVTLNVGDTKQLTATISPSNATDKSVSWTSNNNSVATVSSSGMVTAKSTGTVTITCKANDGSGTSATCSVTVKSSTVEPTGITLPYSRTIKVGESFTMTYTLTPSNATTTLTWSSDDSSIATVSSSGVVKGIKAGTTKIRVKTANGKTDYCNVIVESNAVDPTSITLPASKTVKVGESFTITYTLTPSNATTTLTWSSDDTSIATVSSSGVVKGIKAGTTKIRVKTANGKTDYCNVTVEGNSDNVYPTSISIFKNSSNYRVNSLSMKLSDTYRLTYSYDYPSGTSSSQRVKPSVSWYSSNPDVIVVSDGVLTPVSTGTSVITVKSANGLSDECNATVILQDPLRCNVKQVSAEYHTMLLTTDGLLWVCGYNYYGQLGDGSTTNAFTPMNIMTNVVAVSAGNSHSMIIKNDGSLWACGDNSEGELGDGHSTYDATPTPKKVMDGVTKVSAGRYHSMIVKNDGSLWACGWNQDGQLGDGNNTYRVPTPVKVMDGVASATAGWKYTMILKNDGTLWACGCNDYGQLCDGTTTGSSTPKKVMDDVAKVEVGESYTVILKTDGTLWTCGNNKYGQLGDGTTTNRNTPKKIMDGVVSIATGSYHTMVIKSDGSLWGFGYNNYGQLGDGTTTDRKTPKKIMDSVESVEGGVFHTILLKTDGSLWACGFNHYGSIGDGTNVDRYSPVKIAEAATVSTPKTVTISAAGYATFYSSESAYILPNGLLAQVVTSADNNKLTYKTIADGSVSGVIPKGTAVMLVTDNKQAGTFTLTSSESAVTYTGTNLLHGSDEATTTTGDGYHYKLSYGPTRTKWDNVFGWYWGANDGAPFQIEEHKAWLVVPRGNGTRAAGFSIEGDVLGIETLEELADSPSDIYFDLQGRRVSQPTKRGVYVNNGKKVILK